MRGMSIGASLALVFASQATASTTTIGAWTLTVAPDRPEHSPVCSLKLTTSPRDHPVDAGSQYVFAHRFPAAVLGSYQVDSRKPRPELPLASNPLVNAAMNLGVVYVPVEDLFGARILAIRAMPDESVVTLNIVGLREAFRRASALGCPGYGDRLKAVGPKPNAP